MAKDIQYPNSLIQAPHRLEILKTFKRAKAHVDQLLAKFPQLNPDIIWEALAEQTCIAMDWPAHDVYPPLGDVQWRVTINSFFARVRATYSTLRSSSTLSGTWINRTL